MNQKRRSMDIEDGKQAGARVQRENYWTEQRCVCMPKMFSENVGCCQWTWGILLFIGTLLLLILLPLSFSYVEYDQYALKKNNIENTVEVDGSVYEVGRYYWGVEHVPLAFSRQYKKVTEKFSIFPANGLEFDINVVFFYKLQKDNLGKIYKAFGTVFDNQVVNRANAKIKNTAPGFSLEQYITHRPLITETLYNSLHPDLNSIFIDMPVDKFYLAEVSIPNEIKQRDLDAAVQKQRNIEEQNKQLATIVRKETQKLEQEINANITIVGATAQASYVRIQSEAQAVADKTKSSADGLGLQNLFLQINVTDTPTKEKYISYFAFLDTIA
jgi:regulator of protease activity HflC (stomatin/prohibitin superfamily)